MRSRSTQLANVLLWATAVPADSFLGGSSVPFGRPKRLGSGSDSLQTCSGQQLCRQTCFLGCSSVPFGRPKTLRSGSDSLQTCCCGHHLCRQTLFLGVQVRFAGLKGSAAAPDSLQTCCCGHHLCRQTLFLEVQMRSRSTQLSNVPLWATAVPADCFLEGSSVPFGWPKRLRSGSDSSQTCCCGHHLCWQTLFLGVQVCRLAGLKGFAAAPDSLQTCCCGHHLCRQTLFLEVQMRSLQTCCCGQQLCRQTVFLGVQVCRLAGLKGPAAAQTACKCAAVATTCAGRLFSWGFKLAVSPA